MKPAPPVVLLGFDRGTPLADRLRALHFTPVVTRDLGEARCAVEDLEAPARALVLPPDPELPELGPTLRFLRERAVRPGLRVIVVGPRPVPGARERLRGAGVDLALWEPCDDNELRFLLNYCVYDPALGEARLEPRVPTPLVARVLGGASDRRAHVYSLSVGGAFLATPRPTPEGGEVFLELPLPDRTVTIQAEVVTNNVPGNLERSHLPLGMGVRFGEMEDTTVLSLSSYVEGRARRYQLETSEDEPAPLTKPAGEVMPRPRRPGRPAGSVAPPGDTVAPAAPPEILVLDENAELDDVCGLLREMGVEFRHVDLEPGRPLGARLPRRLLVTTARHALSLLADPGLPGGELEACGKPVGIVVAQEGSRTLQGRLRQQGFTYVVRRPVHPLALRLVLERVLYRGDEKRVTERLPVGTVVEYRTGLRHRPALLVDLSLRGCRLLVARQAEPDTPVTIRFPKDLTDGLPLTLRGWVLRCSHEERSADRPWCLGVAFEELAREAEALVARVLEAQEAGPARLPAEEAAASAAAPAVRNRPLARAARAYRRLAPRRRYRARVAAFERRNVVLPSLIGRDLSTGGMRIEPHPDLAKGDRLSLLLLGSGGERIALRAEVVRDDGPEGLGLRFEDPAPDAKRRLEVVVSGLPMLERLVDGEPAGVPSVVGEIADVLERQPAS